MYRDTSAPHAETTLLPPTTYRQLATETQLSRYYDAADVAAWLDVRGWEVEYAADGTLDRATKGRHSAESAIMTHGGISEAVAVIEGMSCRDAELMIIEHRGGPKPVGPFADNADAYDASNANPDSE